MIPTGWTNEPPEAEAPAMPVTSALLAGGLGKPRPGAVLEQAMARARAAEARELREAAANAPDPDERAAGLVARGVYPGMISQIAGQLGDAQAELESERAKIAKGARVNARVRGMLERGQIAPLDASRMMDGDFGDAHRAGQLELRVERLQRRLAEAQAMAAGPRHQEGPVEAAVTRAQRILADVAAQRAADDAAEAAARAQMARDRKAFYASRGGLPFGDSGDGTEHTGPDCQVCAEGRRLDAARAQPGDYAETPACSGCGYVTCQCGVPGAYVPPGRRAEIYR